MNILLTITGIIFGGGMIGKLIMFFVKRSDEKANANNEDLKVVLEKLSNYSKLINDELLSSITYIKFDTAARTTEIVAQRNLISSTNKELVQLRNKLENSAENGINDLEQCRVVSVSIEEKVNAADEKIKKIKSGLYSGSELKIKALFDNIQSFNSLANILPQPYIIKHRDVANILNELDMKTVNILIKSEFKSVDDLLELNKLLINLLSLIEKAKIVVNDKIIP